MTGKMETLASRNAPRSVAFRAMLLPSRQGRTRRLSIGGLAVLGAAAVAIALEQATDALVLTVPLLGILVASWYGGLPLGLFGLAVVVAVSLPVGQRDTEEFVRLGALVFAAVGGCVLVETMRRAVSNAAGLIEERLAEAERADVAQRRLTDALEGSHLIAFTQDDQLRYTWVQNAIEEFGARSPLGKGDEDLVPADEAAILTRIKSSVLRTGMPQRTEVRLTSQDQQRVYDLFVKPLRGETGTIVGVSGVSSDITERDVMARALAAANQKIAQRERHLRVAVDSANVFLFETDTAGGTLWRSDNFYEYTGTRRDEVRGQRESWRDLALGVVHPDDLPGLTDVLQQSAASGKTLETEFRIRAHDGSYRWFFMRMVPRLDQTGVIQGWTGSATDVDKLRRTEEELREANRAKDEFVSLVSHELRTPITMVLGNAHVLMKSYEKLERESLQTALADIAEAGERLNRIVSDLLVMGRLEQGAAVETEPILLGRFVERLAAEHRARFRQRELKFEARGDPAPVLGNELYLGQVVRNLLSNAEKYSPPQKPIELTVERLDDELRVSVRDYGTGVPPDEQEFIFQPFYRSRASMSAGGVGVGLTVCRRLVEAQGGRIWVHNHEEGGAEFAFALPVVSAD